MSTDWPCEEFETLEEAIEYAEHDWSRMTANDKKYTTEYYVLESVNPDEEADNHWDGDIIKRYK